MNEIPDRDAPKPVEAVVTPAEAPVPARRPFARNPVTVLTLAGFALMAVGIVWLSMRLDEVGGELRALQMRADPPGVDLRPLEARVAALEKRPAGGSVDLAPLTGRIAALEQRPVGTGPDMTPVLGRIAALEQRPAADPRVEALNARMDRLTAGIGALAAEEAALRLAFADAARAASLASRAQTDGLPVLDRMWAEVSALVTVKDGARVLSGPPAEPALERARQAVAAGDLAAAVKALDGIDPGAAAAMAAWRARAEKALATRAALTKAGG